MMKEATKLRKTILALATVTLTASIAVGCSGGNTQENNTNNESSATPTASPSEQPKAVSTYGDTGGLKLPLVDKPTTLTWMVSSETPDLSDKLILKEIEKRTGIKLVLQSYSNATYKDKLKVVLASGELPDLISAIGMTTAEINKLGGQGALAPINKSIDQLPNFKKLYVEQNDWVMKAVTDEKNNLYTWPIYNISRDVNHGFLFRKDIFDKHGIKEWTNTEEFYEALKKLKELYPGSTPYVSKTKDLIFSDWGFGWGISGTYFPAVYDEKDKMWELATIQPEYKEMLDFMKKLYNDGLLDPEFLTDTPTNWTAKMTQPDKAFVTYDWIGRLDLFHNQVKSENPNYDLRYANPVGPTGNIRTLSKVIPEGVLVANNKNKELSLKLLDYLTSPSGAELVTVGVEGDIFNWGPDGKPVYPQLTDVPLVDIKVLDNRYGLWIANMYVRGDDRSVYYNYTEKEQEAQDKINNGKKYEPLDPVLKFKDEETSTIAGLFASLDKSAKEFSTKYILTKAYGDKEWNDWLKNAETLGAKSYVDIYNTAQKRLEAGN